MNVAQETLDFRWAGLPPALSLLMPTSAFLFAPACIAAHLLHLAADPVHPDRRIECSPTTPNLRLEFTASVRGLVPRIIDAESLD